MLVESGTITTKNQPQNTEKTRKPKKSGKELTHRKLFSNKKVPSKKTSNTLLTRKNSAVTKNPYLPPMKSLAGFDINRVNTPLAKIDSFNFDLVD